MRRGESQNGSVKFFGWANSPIFIDTAREIGKQIHKALDDNGLLGAGREVFPHNHGQVLLPIRWDKATIIDTGVLPLCTRKYKDDETGKMVDYKTYSVLNFCDWLRRGGHYDEWTLLKAVQEACANLPDEEPKAVHVREVPIPPEEVATGGTSARYTGDVADNPNSFERQHNALLEFCRRMKRVVTEQEALTYIKANSLYTGRWGKNLARRRARVRWILKRIAETFDPAKCKGIRYEVQVGKFDNWAKSFVGAVRGRDHRSLDEYGNSVVRESRYRVDWRFASTFLSVVEFCLETSPNEDGSLPQVRAEDIWSRCYEGGQAMVPFCEKKWAICRDWLESQGIIKIVDRNWQRGKAMRWAVGERFARLPQWWRREKSPSLLDAVPLEEFLANRYRRHTPSLNTYPPSGGWNLDAAVEDGPIPIRAPP